MSDFLVRSLVLSAVLTVALNVYLAWRARRTARSYSDPELSPQSRAGDGSPIEPPSVPDDRRRPRVRVYIPWKAMLIGSIALTILLNVGALLAR